jgi:MoaA/NifB/PqqE/SkfB family radical SAM enzyme
MLIGPYAKFAVCYCRYKLGVPVPFTCFVYPTFRCNLHCYHCSFGSRDSRAKRFPETMSESDYMVLIDSVARLGVPVLVFSGGEPLLRTDIERIALAAKKKGLYTILLTNGTLIDKTRARSICSAFDCVRVSIDGPIHVHDLNRRASGSFSKTVGGLQLLQAMRRSHRPRVIINYVVQRSNQKHMKQTAHLLRDLCDGISFIPHCGSNHVYASEPSLEAWNHLRRQGMVANLPQFIDRPSLHKGKMYCDLGKLRFNVLPNGDVTLCTLPHSPRLGNVKHELLQSIARRRHDSDVQEALQSCKGCYRTCTTQVTQVFEMNPLQLMWNLPNLAKAL